MLYLMITGVALNDHSALILYACHDHVMFHLMIALHSDRIFKLLTEDYCK